MVEEEEEEVVVEEVKEEEEEEEEVWRSHLMVSYLLCLPLQSLLNFQQASWSNCSTAVTASPRGLRQR